MIADKDLNQQYTYVHMFKFKTLVKHEATDTCDGELEAMELEKKRNEEKVKNIMKEMLDKQDHIQDIHCQMIERMKLFNTLNTASCRIINNSKITKDDLVEILNAFHKSTFLIDLVSRPILGDFKEIPLPNTQDSTLSFSEKHF